VPFTEGYEAVDSRICRAAGRFGGRQRRVLHVLYRVKHRTAARELPSCNVARIKTRAAPMAGCPAWTTKLVRRRGKRIEAVAFGRRRSSRAPGPVLSPETLERAALRMAASALRRMVITVRLRARGHSAGGRGLGFTPGFTDHKYQSTTCGGWLYQRFSARVTRP